MLRLPPEPTAETPVGDFAQESHLPAFVALLAWLDVETSYLHTGHKKCFLFLLATGIIPRALFSDRGAVEP